MQTYLKTKPVWMQLLLFLGMAFGLFIVAFLIGGSILSKMTGLNVMELGDAKNWDLTNPQMITFMRGMLLLQFLFLFSLPALLFSYFSDPQPMHYLGLKAPGSSLYWILGILIIVVAYPFVEYVGYLNQKIPVSGNTEKWLKGMEEEAARQIQFMLREHTFLELAKNLLFIALFAGIGEELFFRGILQRMFIRMTKNAWIGIFLTAALFSAIHFQFYGFFPRLILGILLGAIYWYSGSLWVAILAHFLYDAAVIVLIYFKPELLTNSQATLIQGKEISLLIGAMISLAATFILLRQMQKKSLTSFEAVYNNDFPKPNDNLSF